MTTKWTPNPKFNAEKDQTLWIQLSCGWMKLDQQSQIFEIVELPIPESHGRNTAIGIRKWRQDLKRWFVSQERVKQTPQQIIELIKEAKEAK